MGGTSTDVAAVLGGTVQTTTEAVIGTPPITDSVVVCTVPPSTAATSVEVPPMSKVSRSWWPERRATQAAPTTPPAGPDSTQLAACRAARSISITPPEDCMTSGAG